ncbi:MAG TPA: DUF1566 domain-containing protein [bacterium]|nr:DUF1566 domain-containing protein [bacterium]
MKAFLVPLFLLTWAFFGCSSNGTGEENDAVDDGDDVPVIDDPTANEDASLNDTSLTDDQAILPDEDVPEDDADPPPDTLPTADQDTVSPADDGPDDDLLADGEETDDDAGEENDDATTGDDTDQTGTLTEGEQKFPGAPADMGREGDFTVLDPLGNGETIVVDAATRLVWQQNVAYNDTHTAAMAWGYCISLTYAGYKDWDLPTVHELATIYSYGTTAFEYDEFFTGYSEGFWTDTIDHDNRRWVLYGTGKAEPAPSISDLLYARCVRRTEVPIFTGVRFTYEKGSDNKTIIVDHLTGLQWTPYIYYDSIMWGGALTTCENTTHGGYDDWRLPGVNEMRSIIDYGKYNPASNADYGYGSVIWTSAAYHVGERWIVDIKDGSQSPWESDGAFNVLCVRDPE